MFILLLTTGLNRIKTANTNNIASIQNRIGALGGMTLKQCLSGQDGRCRDQNKRFSSFKVRFQRKHLYSISWYVSKPVLSFLVYFLPSSRTIIFQNKQSTSHFRNCGNPVTPAVIVTSPLCSEDIPVWSGKVFIIHPPSKGKLDASSSGMSTWLSSLPEFSSLVKPVKPRFYEHCYL